MAQVPYEGGVPQVAPETRTPDDYQHIQANPNSFGGLIAQGEQQLGAGASKAGQFFGQVAADNASNDYQDKVDKLLHGDPTKMRTGPDGAPVLGPDGKPVPDTGFLGLKGQPATMAWPQVAQQLEDQRKKIRDTLQTPEQELKFDDFSRRYHSYAVGQVGTHADTQYNAWYTDVEKASSDNALRGLTNAVTSANLTEQQKGEAIQHFESDLVNARLKTAQRLGAQPGDALWNATIDDARRDAFKARLEAISVKEPARAMSMLDKHKDLAGLYYEPLANQFRARADEQTGITAGTEAIKHTYEKVPPSSSVVPVLDQIGRQYGVSGTYLARVRQIESAGDNNAVSPTGPVGPFQFTKATAAQYNLTDRNDLFSSADAAARLAADNKSALQGYLGRPPTDAETYLAHQQGAGGAAKLLANPNARAGDLVGDAAIRNNGGDPNASASEFTSMWTVKFNNAPNTSGQTRKSAAYQEVAGNPNLTEPARNYAITFINRTIAQQTIAEEGDTKARKAASDKAAKDYVTRMLNGNMQNITTDIANDPNLEWQTRQHLADAAEKKSGSDVIGALQTYGPGFWDAYKGVTAPVNDPARIGDPTQLLARAGPDGDLTLAGVQKLWQISKESQGSVNDQAVNTTKTGLMNYAKQKLSFEQDTGPIKIRDPKGEAIFQARFIPKFLAAYDKWTKDGKDPWEFLTQENVDKMIVGMRSKSEMEMERLKATGEVAPDAKEPPNAPLPATPEGFNEYGWKQVIQSPPTLTTGQVATHQQWAQALQILGSQRTPEVKAAFNKWFGAGGYDADKVLGQLDAHEPPGMMERIGGAGSSVLGALGRFRQSNKQAIEADVASRKDNRPPVIPAVPEDQSGVRGTLQ